MRSVLFFLIFLFHLPAFSRVQVGADLLFENRALLKGKKIGLITNQTGINGSLQTTFAALKANAKDYQLVAVFAPEHGFFGDTHAGDEVEDNKLGNIPLYSLHGKHRRPTNEMLSGINLLIFDIQDIGSRSYTYLSTLFYCMEEAAARKIPLIVLDRPNPTGGLVVDGTTIEERWRSFIGYLNIPDCYGMTVGELANLFNGEYEVGCDLKVISMRGWKRGMTFAETGLPWVPTSPQIPESDTPFYYLATGIIGHSSIVNIGVGYTLPFKVVGAPWIQAEKLARSLNAQNLSGVHFQPFCFCPFFGKFKNKKCQGVHIVVTDPAIFQPLTTEYTILGVLKALYPQQFDEAIGHLVSSRNKVDLFNKMSGSEEILNILCKERFVIWKLREKCAKARDAFLPIRKKYLNPDYF